jgi:O-antigen/teichoic acid export membrane protein
MASKSRWSWARNGDAVWTAASFALVGLAGLLLILGIARFYSTATLGSFNLVYSFYIVGSQLVGAGIHFSVLRHSAARSAESRADRAVLPAALLGSFANAIVWILVLAALTPLLVRWYQSELLADSIWYVFPAFLFCGQNKILLSHLNAVQAMRRFAGYTMFRALAILLLLAVAVMTELEGHRLPLILSGAEFLLYASMMSHQRQCLVGVPWTDIRIWLRRHVSFGYRSVAGSVFVDLNTRVDILVLGLFCSDRLVGIYSLAAMLYDGFAQLPMVVRTLINPRITMLHHDGGAPLVEAYARQVRNRSYVAFGAVGLVIVALYLPMVELLTLREDFRLGFAPLAILIAGAVLTIGYSPLLMIFNQLGFPFRQSILYLICFGSNVVMNFLFVPWWGIHGAAVGTVASFAILVIAMKLLLRGVGGIRI